MNFRHIPYKIFVFTLASLLISCGGGGGGGSSPSTSNAATAVVDISPSTIDTGDRTEVTTYISEIHEDGISLKLKVPSTLHYVVDSASLKVDGSYIVMEPDYNKTWKGSRYLVFFFKQSTFGNGNYGELRLQLEGTGVVNDGYVEVDADVDDHNIPNSQEFVASAPEFTTEDAANIRVK